MTRLLVMVAASLGLTISAAGACGFKNSAEAKIDQTVVASVAVDESMSTPVSQTVAVDEMTPAAPADKAAE